jgi:hypothetical protein
MQGTSALWNSSEGFRQRLLSGATGLSFDPLLSFDQLKMTPQFGAMLIDLIARLAALKRCKRRVCKFFPRQTQQLLQAVYVSGQNFQICHLQPFEVNDQLREDSSDSAPLFKRDADPVLPSPRDMAGQSQLIVQNY